MREGGWGRGRRAYFFDLGASVAVRMGMVAVGWVARGGVVGLRAGVGGRVVVGLFCFVVGFVHVSWSAGVSGVRGRRGGGVILSALWLWVFSLGSDPSLLFAGGDAAE